MSTVFLKDSAMKTQLNHSAADLQQFTANQAATGDVFAQCVSDPFGALTECVSDPFGAFAKAVDVPFGVFAKAVDVPFGVFAKCIDVPGSAAV
jgi:hypothetical protein